MRAWPFTSARKYYQVQGEHLLGQLLQQLVGQERWQLLGGPGAQQINVTTQQAQIAGRCRDEPFLGHLHHPTASG